MYLIPNTNNTIIATIIPTQVIMFTILPATVVISPVSTFDSSAFWNMFATSPAVALATVVNAIIAIANINNTAKILLNFFMFHPPS